MTIVNPSAWIQARDDHPAVLYRRVLATLAGEGVGGMNGANDLKVSQDTGANMNSKIAWGAGIIQGDDAPDQGNYLVFNNNTAPETLTHDASDGTNPRIDLVVAKQIDTAYGGASDEWDLVIVKGTPGGVPVAPAVPASCLVLAQILIPAASTAVVDANITDRRVVATRKIASARARVHKSSTQNVANGGTGEEGIFQVEDKDTHGFFVSTANTRMTVPFDGVFRPTAQAEWTAAAGGSVRRLQIKKNGTVIAQNKVVAATGAFPSGQTVIHQVVGPAIDCVAGDYFEVNYFQNSGAALIVSGSTDVWFELVQE